MCFGGEIIASILELICPELVEGKGMEFIKLTHQQINPTFFK